MSDKEVVEGKLCANINEMPDSRFLRAHEAWTEGVEKNLEGADGAR